MPADKSVEIAVRDDAAPAMPLPPMDDAEMAALYRTAKALAESRLFKDAMQAGQAFAKILAGRDLGLTPFESMSALHVIQGKIEAGADLHATRVRSREGYDFRVAWIKETPHIKLQGEHEQPAVREAVYADEDSATDMREIVGCAIEFSVDGKTRGVSVFTKEDQKRAELANLHGKYPRNMWFARAMTNGVAWFVPEVMGGMRVYDAGEISEHLGADDLTASAPRGAIGEQAADSLPTAVEAVIARAAKLGHMGLANREAAAMAVNGQPDEAVAEWCQRATTDLNRLAAGKAPQEPVIDASAVDEPAEPVSGSVSAESAQAPESTDQPDAAPHAPVAPPEASEYASPTADEQRAADDLGMPIVSQGFLDDGPPRRAEPMKVDPERIAEMRERVGQLLDEATAFEADGDEDAAARAMEEADALGAEIDAANQTTLEL